VDNRPWTMDCGLWSVDYSILQAFILKLFGHLDFEIVLDLEFRIWDLLYLWTVVCGLLCELRYPNHSDFCAPIG